MYSPLKRLLALIVTLLLCLSLLPAAALAESEAEEPRAVEGDDPYSDGETPSDDADEPVVADAPGGPADDPDEPVGTDAPDGPEEDPSASTDGSAQDDTGDDPDALPPEGDETQAIASGDCGDSLIWSLSDAGVLTIAGSGDMWDWDFYHSSPWYDHRDEIVSARIMSGVTSIGNYAFRECSNLTGVTIPEGVTSMGNSAFFDCRGLTGVEIPNSVISIGAGAFYNCWGLTSVTIPEGVTSIGSGAFLLCDGLTSITIPQSVTSIGSQPFHECRELTDIWYGSTKAAWKQLGVDYDHYRVAVHCSDGDHGPFDSNYCGDDLIWSLDGSGVLTVAGSGAMWNFEMCTAPWYDRRSEIQTVRLLSGLTGIGDYAFADCSGMTSVTIPEGVTGIGDYAFYSCSGLTSVSIPSSVTSIGEAAFNSCSGMTSVTIPEGVTGIEYAAFAGCRSLTSVTIPASVTSIRDAAFASCSSLAEIRFQGAAPSLGDNCFNNVTATAYYPQADPSWTEEVRQNYGGTITWVGYGPIASGQCGDDLTWVLEDGILTISGTGDMWDFEYCGPWISCRYDIKKIVLIYGVSSIGANAFFDCAYGMDSVMIPGSVTCIGSGAFRECDSLTSITIPESVTSIEGNAFFDCDILTDIWYGSTKAAWKQLGVDYDHYSVTVHCSDGDISPADTMYCGDDLIWTLNSSGVLTIAGTGDMWDFEWGRAPWYGRRSEIVTVRLLSSVTSIGNYAFFECSSLTSVTIPEGVTSIGNVAFQSCSSLTSVTIPAGVTSIGYGAFAGCSSLTSVEIPAGVTSIGDNAFSNCSSLTSITIPQSVTSIGVGAFRDCSSLTSVTIPASVTSIGPGAFSSCSSLTSVTIPASVTSIGPVAFSSCSSLTEIRFQGAAPSLGDNCFNNVTATAYYPANDPTWTEEVRQNYGGNITWVAYTPEIPGIPIDEEHFPDPLFRSYVAENFDPDRDGLLSEEERLAVTTINVSSRGLTSLEGIALFPALTVLHCEENQLTALDLSQNPALRSLNCYYNHLTALDLSRNPALTDLYCNGNQLTALDLSQNPALESLHCESNHLTALDLSRNPALTYLWCFDNQIHSLDLRPCPALLAVSQTEPTAFNPNWFEGAVAYLGQDTGSGPDSWLVVDEMTRLIRTDADLRIPGDINNDGNVNGFDLIRLRKYLAGDDVEINASNTDVNGDGKISGLDLIRLRKYLAGDDVTLN